LAPLFCVSLGAPDVDKNRQLQGGQVNENAVEQGGFLRPLFLTTSCFKY